MHWLSMLLTGSLILSWSASAQSAETITADHVKISIVAPPTLSPSGQVLGLRFEIDPNWHIYWKNPGDSGTAPKFNLSSAQGTITGISWPLPRRIEIGTLTNIGYEHEVIFPFTLVPSIQEGTVSLTADLEWLVCQEECIPGFGQITLKRPIGDPGTNWEHQKDLDIALKSIPRPANESPWKIESVKRTADELAVILSSPQSTPLASAFPLEPEFLKPAAPTLGGDGKSLVFKVQSGQATPSHFGLVLSDGKGSWDLGTIETLAPSKSEGPLAFLLLLLSAFAGGILLNLMPCVLPVLSIKFFSLAKVSAQTRWREAMLYTLGVLVTFTALGGVFLGLRAGGAAIGWGFQLQSPPIVGALIILFWLMGLSFLGFFEFGNSLTRAAGKFENTGSFATGCLSVFIATPCTGPFMGTALGAATVLPATEALTIFFFLGLGLASPFLALACFPRIRLPKPGMWMITLRQFLAFPLFATVLWLLWILGQQLGTDAWFYCSILGLVLAFCIWLGKGRGALFKALSYLLAVASIFAGGKWIIAAPLQAEVKAREDDRAVTWVDYSPQTITEATARGQAVFVDFTAAWCVTCQVNKKAVLETKAADALFAAHNVKLIRADWTNLDDTITTALAAFDRASVPLYLYYPSDGSKPKILPQILTMSDIEGLFPQ